MLKWFKKGSNKKKEAEAAAASAATAASSPSVSAYATAGSAPARLFAVELQQLLEWDRQDYQIPLLPYPVFLGHIVERIGNDISVLSTEGLFRVPGNHQTVESIKYYMDMGQPVDFAAVDVFSVCSVLGLWLRSLPEPLCTFELYDEFISIGQTDLTEVQYVEQLRALVFKIRSPFIETISPLFHFYRIIANHAEQNKMTSSNLAIAIGSSIFRPRIDSAARALSDQQAIQRITTVLIEHAQSIFPTPLPLDGSQTPVPSSPSSLSTPVAASSSSSSPPPQPPPPQVTPEISPSSSLAPVPQQPELHLSASNVPLKQDSEETLDAEEKEDAKQKAEKMRAFFAAKKNAASAPGAASASASGTPVSEQVDATPASPSGEGKTTVKKKKAYAKSSESTAAAAPAESSNSALPVESPAPSAPASVPASVAQAPAVAGIIPSEPSFAFTAPPLPSLGASTPSLPEFSSASSAPTFSAPPLSFNFTAPSPTPTPSSAPVKAAEAAPQPAPAPVAPVPIVPSAPAPVAVPKDELHQLPAPAASVAAPVSVSEPIVAQPEPSPIVPQPITILASSSSAPVTVPTPSAVSVSAPVPAPTLAPSSPPFATAVSTAVHPEAPSSPPPATPASPNAEDRKMSSSAASSAAVDGKRSLRSVLEEYRSKMDEDLSAMRSFVLSSVDQTVNQLRQDILQIAQELRVIPILQQSLQDERSMREKIQMDMGTILLQLRDSVEREKLRDAKIEALESLVHQILPPSVPSPALSSRSASVSVVPSIAPSVSVPAAPVSIAPPPAAPVTIAPQPLQQAPPQLQQAEAPPQPLTRLQKLQQLADSIEAEEEIHAQQQFAQANQRSAVPRDSLDVSAAPSGRYSQPQAQPQPQPQLHSWSNGSQDSSLDMQEPSPLSAPSLSRAPNRPAPGRQQQQQPEPLHSHSIAPEYEQHQMYAEGMAPQYHDGPEEQGELVGRLDSLRQTVDDRRRTLLSNIPEHHQPSRHEAWNSQPSIQDRLSLNRFIQPQQPQQSYGYDDHSSYQQEQQPSVSIPDDVDSLQGDELSVQHPMQDRFDQYPPHLQQQQQAYEAYQPRNSQPQYDSPYEVPPISSASAFGGHPHQHSDYHPHQFQQQQQQQQQQRQTIGSMFLRKGAAPSAPSAMPPSAQRQQYEQPSYIPTPSSSNRSTSPSVNRKIPSSFSSAPIAPPYGSYERDEYEAGLSAASPSSQGYASLSVAPPSASRRGPSAGAAAAAAYAAASQPYSRPQQSPASFSSIPPSRYEYEDDDGSSLSPMNAVAERVNNLRAVNRLVAPVGPMSPQQQRQGRSFQPQQSERPAPRSLSAGRVSSATAIRSAMGDARLQFIKNGLNADYQ